MCVCVSCDHGMCVCAHAVFKERETNSYKLSPNTLTTIASELPGVSVGT